MKINEVITEKFPNIEVPKGSSFKMPPVNKNAENQLAIFIGPNAKNFNNELARLAQQMEKDGAHRDEIWHDTGTYRNSNGDWRQEISDKDFEFKIDPTSIKPGTSYKASDIFNHTAFFDNYHNARNIEIVFKDPKDMEGSDGSWDQYNNTISLAKHPSVAGNEYAEWEEYLDVAVHELEHVAQSKEKPNNHEYVTPDIEYNNPFGLSDYEQYAADSKEARARLVSQRRELSFPQRAAGTTPSPTDTDQLITQKRKNAINYNNSFDTTTPGSTQSNLNPLTIGDNPWAYDITSDPMQDPKNAKVRGTVPKNKSGDHYDDVPKDWSKGHKHSKPPVVNKAPAVKKTTPK